MRDKLPAPEPFTVGRTGPLYVGPLWLILEHVHRGGWCGCGSCKKKLEPVGEREEGEAGA